MPLMMADARIQEKFQDQEYLENVEHMFREKFIENLGVSYLHFWVFFSYSYSLIFDILGV